MRRGADTILRTAARLVAALAAAALTACVAESPYTTPDPLVSPYPGDHQALWAVVPPANESGLSTVDGAAIGDEIVNAIQQVRGIRALPINRTLDAMRELDLRSIRTSAEARQLSRTLGADAIVIGSVTAYDPYEPPALGLTLALFLRSSELPESGSLLYDPRLLQMQATELTAQIEADTTRPSSVGGGLYDARAHDVVARLQAYARGRIEPDSPYGWRIYLVSMGLYSEFVAHSAVQDLIESEWLRLAGAPAR